MAIDFEALHEKYGATEFRQFERVQGLHRLSNRPDLNALLLLDRLFPESRDIICCARHEEIFLDISVDQFNKAATEFLALNLIRCGVRVDDEHLAMFV